MISNDRELDIVRQQIGRLENALQSLSKTVRPQSERQFRLMAEGYVDQLEVLRQEVEAYLGISAIKSPEPDVEVSIDDPEAALGDTRVSAVTKLADRFRRALRTTVEAVRDAMSPVDRQNLSDDFLDRLCDPPLQAVAPGSVKVQLASPQIAVGSELYKQGLDLLALAARSASGDVQATAQFQALPLTHQKAALSAAKILAPDRGDLVGRVGLGGHFIGPEHHIQFDFKTRKRIIKRLSRIARESSTRKVEGVIREVDLDRRLFSLRETDTGLTVERCKYGKNFDSQIAGLIDKRVEVIGTRRSNALRATRLRVREIRELGG
jgi:hypothetical protein